MSKRREAKPMDHQRAAVRAELHAIVDRLVDDWEWIDSLEGSLRAVGSGGGGGGTPKGSHADPTFEAAAMGDEAARWLDRFRAFRVEARLIDAARANMAPAKVKAKRGRENTVDVCVRCNLPNPKVHRIDNEPYCATSCYYAEHRERKRKAEEAKAS